MLSSTICSDNTRSRANRCARGLRTQFSLYDHQCVHKIVQKYFPLLHFQPIDLSPGDLLYYGGVEWLNISDFLGKIKKVKIEKRRLTITQQENNSINKIVCLP